MDRDRGHRGGWTGDRGTGRTGEAGRTVGHKGKGGQGEHGYLSRNFCNQVAFVGVFKRHSIWVISFHHDLQ